MKWRHALYVIIAVAAVTHLYPIWEIPLFGDELGVLLRADVRKYTELIQESIMAQDVHPLGVQSIYYVLYGQWQWPVWSLKLLSALSGIGSVILVAIIGRLCGRPKTGVLAAAVLAVLQMSLYYSVLIRPYAFGQFFFLVYVAGHYRWISTNSLNRSRILLLGLLLSILGAIHYMALLTAIVFYLVSLAERKVRDQWKGYLGIALFGGLTYIPQLPVFLSHLGKGNPGNWLTPADASFFFEFFGYVIHYSWLFGVVLTAIVVTSLLFWFRIRTNAPKLYWTGILVFFWRRLC